MLYRWPTDPPGKPARHTRPYAGGHGVGKVKPPGPAPAPAPIARPSAPPVDPTYQAQIAQLSRSQDENVAGISAGRQRGLIDYGFTETGYNPATGTAGLLQFNPNDPFSKAAQLKKNYDTQRRSAGQGMGSGGQLYSGAYQKTQNVVNRGQLQSEDALQRSLIDFLANNSSQYARAGTDYATGGQQAALEAAARVADNPLYEPTSGLAPTAVGPVKPKPKKNKKKGKR